MDPTDLRIRPLESRDLPAVAAIHRAAFSGYRTTLLGPRFLRRMYAWFLAHPEGFGWVVERSDGVCGFAVGSAVEEGSALLRFTAGEIARALLTRPWTLLQPQISTGIWRRLQAHTSALFHRQPQPPSPPSRTPVGAAGKELRTAYLWGIGVHPDHQGRGIGTALMTAFEQDAIQRGYGRGQLMVRHGNETASRCYQKCGWSEVASLGTSESLTYAKEFFIPSEGRSPSPSAAA